LARKKNTHAATVMLVEKAADMVREDGEALGVLGRKQSSLACCG
jgi:hypothetical protein